MKSFNYVITDEVGIHARPAGQLAKMVKELTSKVTIEANGKSAEATEMFRLHAASLLRTISTRSGGKRNFFRARTSRYSARISSFTRRTVSPLNTESRT